MRNIFENAVSDLAIERRRADLSLEGIDYRVDPCSVGRWERLRIYSEEGAKSIGRPMGLYDTLSTKRMDCLDPAEIEDAKDEVASELCRMFECTKTYPDKLLVVGLGNSHLTPDAVGPLAAAGVEATMHLYDADKKAFYMLECSAISVLIPRVPSESGLDTARTVKSLTKEIKPDAVIAIDALAARAPERLGRTVQISSTGIFAGSGLGLGGSAIDEESVGCPVFAIGVPTVINAAYLSQGKEGSDTHSDMFVSPKEINIIVENAAKIISGGINQAFGVAF